MAGLNGSQALRKSREQTKNGLVWASGLTKMDGRASLEKGRPPYEKIACDFHATNMLKSKKHGFIMLIARKVCPNMRLTKMSHVDHMILTCETSNRMRVLCDQHVKI